MVDGRWWMDDSERSGNGYLCISPDNKEPFVSVKGSNSPGRVVHQPSTIHAYFQPIMSLLHSLRQFLCHIRMLP